MNLFFRADKEIEERPQGVKMVKKDNMLKDWMKVKGEERPEIYNAAGIKKRTLKTEGAQMEKQRKSRFIM